MDTNGRNEVFLEISWGFCYCQISPNADPVGSRLLGQWKSGHLENTGTGKPFYHILSYPILSHPITSHHQMRPFEISCDSVSIPSRTANQKIVYCKIAPFGGTGQQHVENFSRCRCFFLPRFLDQTFFWNACLHCDESYNGREKT